MVKLHGWRSVATAMAAVVALAAFAITPAMAVTDGTPDNNGHPMVGLMVAQDANGVPLWRCSGTLMSSTVFMVAGHCTESPAAHAEIWFAPGPIPLAAGYPAAGNNPCKNIDGYPCKGDTGGAVYTHPQYDPNAFYLYDLGVVVLKQQMRGISQYGQLPALNSLDSLQPGSSTIFTAVGYGLQKNFPDAADWKSESTRIRLYANPYLNQINTNFTGDYSLLLSNNSSSGGTCNGDSGGPNFLGTSLVVAGVTSYGLNQTCAGHGGVYRVDRADDLDWLATFGLH
jgi:hypothetical protein